MTRHLIRAISPALLVLACATASSEASPSLYSGPGPRPGPDILYSKPAHAPQLANRGVWEAAPILVSGASAYREGEFLYQDFLYDDHGARLEFDPTDPRFPGNTFSGPNGTYLYPSDDAYAENAADIVEFRVKPLARATAFRVTLNSMTDPGLVGLTIALGDSGEPREFPHGANVVAPAQYFLTVHGEEGELIDAASGEPAGPQPRVTTSLRRRQITIRLAHAAFDPGRRTVRVAMGTGIWDESSDGYMLPGAIRSESEPGGAGLSPAPAAFFNIAFRERESWPEVSDINQASPMLDVSWWRDRLQGHALAAGDISRFFAEVDFGKLLRGVTDNSEIPKRGPMNRILASHFPAGQGADYSVVCLTEAADCTGPYLGRLQPYAVYVPRRPEPKGGFGMTLLLHSLGATYNQFSDSMNQSQFGERGKGSIVITPLGRGPDGSYDAYAAADTFEVWADVARRYKLDPGFTSIAGYSMGAFGTFKFASEFPDLFARAQPTVGAASGPLENLRNVPVLMWNAIADELVNPALYLPTANELGELGYRYELDQFVAEHLTLAYNDQYAPAAKFLGTHRVERNPAHVTYAIERSADYPELGFVADHAYWLSHVRLYGETGGVDVRSLGFGVGDPPVEPLGTAPGSLDGGTISSIPFVAMGQTWGKAPVEPRRDVLEISAEGVRSLTIHPRRARVSCDAELEVETNTQVEVKLAGCDSAATFGLD